MRHTSGRSHAMYRGITVMIGSTISILLAITWGGAAIPVDVGARPGSSDHRRHRHTGILRLGNVLVERADSKPGV